MDTTLIIGHLEGKTDPRTTPGFDNPKQALRQGAALLEEVEHLKGTLNGHIILSALQVFHTTAGDQYTKLAALYGWMCKNTLETECLPLPDLEKAYRAGRELASRAQAAQFYADCLLKLDREVGDDNWVRFEFSYELWRVPTKYKENYRRIHKAESLDQILAWESEKEKLYGDEVLMGWKARRIHGA